MDKELGFIELKERALESILMKKIEIKKDWIDSEGGLTWGASDALDSLSFSYKAIESAESSEEIYKELNKLISMIGL